MIAPHPTRRTLITTAVLAAGLGGCERALAYKVDALGFRLRLELFVGGQRRLVEAVRRIESWSYYGWVPTANRSFRNDFGDAIPIDIGSRTLFLTRAGYQQLLDGPREPTGVWTPELVYRARGIKNPPNWARRQPGLAVDLSFDELPVFVTLTDIANPNSIMIINPETVAEHFPGVRFGRSRVEWTRDPPTRTDIRKRLPWVYDDSPKREVYPFVWADRFMFGP